MGKFGPPHEDPIHAEESTSVRNPLATAGLTMGLLSILMVAVSLMWGRPLFWITSVPAMAFGFLGMRKVGRSFTKAPGYAGARVGFFLGLGIAIIMPLSISIALPLAFEVSKKGDQAQAINNCRKVMICLRLYSPDNCGSYPDVIPLTTNTSNEVFRTLFKAGVADDEKIFSCDLSPFKPDGKIGAFPDFKEALQKGENHWAMTRGLTDFSPGSFPLVYENAATSTGIPQWNADAAGMAKPGRCWPGGKVIIAFNDGSVVAKPLEAKHGEKVALAPSEDGSPIFWPSSSGSSASLEVLNVDR